MFLLRLLPALPREIAFAVVGLCAGAFLAVVDSLHGYGETTGVAGSVQVTHGERASGGWAEPWADGWAWEGSAAGVRAACG
ncbi:hypothetical protein [Streptomyces sp. NPDC096012]|uniref:hypothetical protein n=1 Tax=Streptomyces sp. NPDC096012 TaxID=3155684 RepID=UPI00336A0771